MQIVVGEKWHVMSAKFSWEFSLCPESTVASQYKALFSGDSKETGNFNGRALLKFVSCSREAG